MVASLPEKMIRKLFGVRRMSREEKKCNFKKKVLSAFFRHNVSEKQSVCGYVMCPRNHGGKKVICKK